MVHFDEIFGNSTLLNFKKFNLYVRLWMFAQRWSLATKFSPENFLYFRISNLVCWFVLPIFVRLRRKFVRYGPRRRGPRGPSVGCACLPAPLLRLRAGRACSARKRATGAFSRGHNQATTDRGRDQRAGTESWDRGSAALLLAEIGIGERLRFARREWGRML